MPPTPLRKPSVWLQALLLVALATIGLAAIFGRTSWAAWGEPHWLEGDPLEVYARVRIAGEQPGHALANFAQVTRLGAPAGADWSAYPVPDRLVFVLTGLLARGLGLVAAVQLVAALILGLNAASFYLCARWLRWRWEWAAALGLVFALGSYNLRWGITLSFSQTFFLPPLVLLCARAARLAPWTGSRRLWLALGSGLGLWLGTANPYLAFFAGVVAGGALILALLRRVPRPRFMPLGLFLGCLVATFAAANAGYVGELRRGATAEALVRGAGDLHTYALRPADWFVPPADHRVAALARLGHTYQSAWRGTGEFFYNYLGLAGLAGLVLLAGQSGRRLIRHRGQRGDPLLGVGWITAFGLAGGLNTWLGATGLNLFRAGTRIGIYAVVWSLLALGSWLNRRTRRLARPASVTLAALLAVVAIWEQTPALADRAAPERNQTRWLAVSALTARLESQLPAGAAVFQLPAVPFPEAGPVGTMTDYAHFLPFLTSHSLRFSYGQLRPSPWLKWARAIERRPAREMVAALERAGFAVLWVDRRAYADGGEALTAQLRSLGREEVAAGDLPVRVFRLQPAAVAQPPDFDDPRLAEPWDKAAPQPGLLALDGWYPLENQGPARWRWARQHAALGYWHDGLATTGTLRFLVRGPAKSVVVLRLGNHELWRGPTGPGTHTVTVSLPAGLTTFEWTLEGLTFRPGGHDIRELGFMVENLSLSVP